MAFHAYPPMLRVSASHPCPVCMKPDWCLSAEDGSAAICQRIEDGALKRSGDAGWLHLLSPNFRPAAPTPPRSAPRPPPQDSHDFERILQERPAPPEWAVEQIAAELGITESSLRRLKVTIDPSRTWWFPERDAAGRVIGINRRDPAGNKRCWPGGKRGLSYADDWDTGQGPLLLPEGASDTLALMSLGSSTIGRPSNRGGCALLGEMLSGFDREIIVLGEYDQKPGGQWPGREGAVHTATELAKRLDRPVGWSLPPDSAKDVRAWLKAHPTPDPRRLREVFLAGMVPQQVTPPPTVRAERRRPSDTTLEDYRAELIRVRLASLDRPGVYLDRSPTGAGKSHADLTVLRQWLRPGGAA